MAIDCLLCINCHNRSVPPTFSSSLQDRLDAITQQTRRLVQPERLALSEQAAADLLATGIEDHVLPVGAQAPAFTLEDATGKLIHSADLLALGPLVVTFFRGRWDPYCVTELEAWRDLYPTLRHAGALLVAISPQTVRQNAFAAEQHRLPFPVLSDPGCVVAEHFGIAYTLPDPMRRYYRSILVNIPFANAGLSYERATEASYRLPLPATFLIRSDGTTAFSEAHADPRVRPEPAALLTTCLHSS